MYMHALPLSLSLSHSMFLSHDFLRLFFSRSLTCFAAAGVVVVVTNATNVAAGAASQPPYMLIDFSLSLPISCLGSCF